jgi:hypothetical protein
MSVFQEDFLNNLVEINFPGFTSLVLMTSYSGWPAPPTITLSKANPVEDHNLYTETIKDGIPPLPNIVHPATAKMRGHLYAWSEPAAISPDTAGSTLIFNLDKLKNLPPKKSFYSFNVNIPAGSVEVAYSWFVWRSDPIGYPFPNMTQPGAPHYFNDGGHDYGFDSVWGSEAEADTRAAWLVANGNAYTVYRGPPSYTAFGVSGVRVLTFQDKKDYLDGSVMGSQLSDKSLGFHQDQAHLPIPLASTAHIVTCTVNFKTLQLQLSAT